MRSTSTTPLTLRSAFITPFSWSRSLQWNVKMLRARPSSPARQFASLMLMLCALKVWLDGREDAGLVRGRDAELHRAVDLRLRVPADLHAALGIRVERLRALAAMNRDAAAARDEADDGVAGQRVTALGVAHEHVVDAVQP